MAHWWNDNERGKPMSQCHLVYYKLMGQRGCLIRQKHIKHNTAVHYKHVLVI